MPDRDRFAADRLGPQPSHDRTAEEAVPAHDEDYPPIESKIHAHSPHF
jgi:hypothetical protein